MYVLSMGLFSSPHTAAKMMVHLDSSSDTKAAELATALDESLDNRTIQVCSQKVMHSDCHRRCRHICYTIISHFSSV